MSKRDPKERFKRVEVEWVDSVTFGGWRSVESYREHTKPETIRTAGYLLSKTRTHLTIIQSFDVDSEGNITDAITIPRSVVRNLTYLEPKK